MWLTRIQSLSSYLIVGSIMSIFVLYYYNLEVFENFGLSRLSIKIEIEMLERKVQNLEHGNFWLA